MAPSPERVAAVLMDYENMGVIAELTALLVGRPMRYSHADKQRLRDYVVARTAGFGFPVLLDMDFGHTAPRLTLPLGVRVQVNADSLRVNVLESAVTA